MKRLVLSFAIAVAAVLVALAPGLSAQEETSLSSDWMELVKGEKDKDTGVELRDIEPGAEAGTRTITLAVPKTSIKDPDDIEEVLVVGRRPDKTEMPKMNIKYKWVRDYDNDNYGLVITLGEGNWPIRLFMNSRPGYMDDGQ